MSRKRAKHLSIIFCLPPHLETGAEGGARCGAADLPVDAHVRRRDRHAGSDGAAARGPLRELDELASIVAVQVDQLHVEREIWCRKRPRPPA